MVSTEKVDKRLHGCQYKYYTERMAILNKKAVQLEQLQRLISDVERVTIEKGSPAPGEFLASVMSGFDPRNIESPLYDIVRKISLREFTGGDPLPTMGEWTEISSIVLSDSQYRKARVPIEQSLQAAQRLMDFLHAKMKAVEVSGSMDVTLEVKPLSGADLDAFKERFENEF